MTQMYSVYLKSHLKISNNPYAVIPEVRHWEKYAIRHISSVTLLVSYIFGDICQVFKKQSCTQAKCNVCIVQLN
jgi:hypothetical protein